MPEAAPASGTPVEAPCLGCHQPVRGVWVANGLRTYRTPVNDAGQRIDRCAGCGASLAPWQLAWPDGSDVPPWE